MVSEIFKLKLIIIDYWLEKPEEDYIIIQNHFGENNNALKRIAYFNRIIAENLFNEDYLNEFFFEKQMKNII